MGYLANGRNPELTPPEFSRPVTTSADLLLGSDCRLGPSAAAQRLPLAAMGVYAMIVGWPAEGGPTAAELAAYSGTPVHEMDQLVTLLWDHAYIERAADV